MKNILAVILIGLLGVTGVTLSLPAEAGSYYERYLRYKADREARRSGTFNYYRGSGTQAQRSPYAYGAGQGYTVIPYPEDGIPGPYYFGGHGQYPRY